MASRSSKVNDIIKKGMPVFCSNFLQGRIQEVRLILDKHNLPEQDLVLILNNIIGIKYDILTCFREMTTQEKEVIAQKYKEHTLWK